MAANRKKFSRQEKWLFASCGLGVLVVAAAIWRQQSNADPVVAFPVEPPPVPNGYDYFVKAEDAYVPNSVPNKPGRDYGREYVSTQRYPLADRKAWLASNASSLTLLRQGFSYDSQNLGLWRKGVSEFGASRTDILVRLLTVESRAYAEQKDWKRAASSAVDMIQLGLELQRGGDLRCAGVGNSAIRAGCNELCSLLPNVELQTARILSRRLEELHRRRESYTNMLLQSKWDGQWGLQVLYESREWRYYLAESHIREAELDAASAPSSSIRPGFLERAKASINLRMSAELLNKRSLMSEYLRFMDEIIAESRTPYPQRPKKRPTPAYAFHTTATGFDTNRCRLTRYETTMALLVARVALTAFQLERGHPPDTMLELVPTLLSNVPVDPFSNNQALRYRRTGKAFRLWSIGPDGVDDNGTPVFNARNKGAARYRVVEDSKGDIVSGIN